MYVGCCDRDPLVSVKKRVALDQALKKGSRLRYWIVVVAALGPEDGTLERSKVTNPVGPSEFVDENSVKRKHLNETEVVGQLFGQLGV